MNGSNYLTITDVQSGVSVDVPISDNETIDARSLQQFKINQTIPLPELPEDKVPLRFYDPGFKNTTVSNTKISLVDGTSGKLYYRGYDVEELVERSSYLEVSYLLIYGELPTESQLEKWTWSVMHHTYLHTELARQMQTFRYDAHPMGMFISTMASMSTFHPDGNPALQGESMFQKPKNVNSNYDTSVSDELKTELKIIQALREKHIYRMIGKATTIAANAYRHRIGRDYNHPMPNSINYCENLLYMMDKLNEPVYNPDSRLVRILDKLFIVLAEHGSNCATVSMRHLTSSGVDPYTALSGSMAALFGERKCHAVIDMLNMIGKPENISGFLEVVKKKGTDISLFNRQSKKKSSTKPIRLMGFGHRVYKTHDPRVRITKSVALELFDLMGKDNIANLAVKLEEAALKDFWFVERQLYPNVDYWTAIILHTLGFPKDMFPVWLAIPRISGFLAHWIESLDDPEFKIYRPRQIYIGHNVRPFESDVDRDRDIAPELAHGYVTADPVAAKRRVTGGGEKMNEQELDLVLLRATHELEELSKTIDKTRLEGVHSEGEDNILEWFQRTLAGIQQTSMLASNLQKTQQELMEKFQKFKSSSSNSIKSETSSDDKKKANYTNSPNLTKGSSHVRVINSQ